MDRTDLNSDAALTSNTDVPTAALKKRKAPHCRKCKQPRQGHPRSGCPFVNLPLPGANVSGISDIGSKLIETSDSKVGVAMDPSYTQTLMRSELESPLVPSATSLKEAEVKPSISEDFRNDVDNILIPPKRIQEAPVAKAATTPSAANVTKIKLGLQPHMPSSVPYISPSTADVSQKQELLSTSPIGCSRNGQHFKLEEPEDNSESDYGRAVQCHHSPELILPERTSATERDAFSLMLFGQAPGTIFIIPNVDAGAILNQAAALKFKMKLIANKGDDPEDPDVPIMLNNEEKELQTLISAVMTDAASDRIVLRSRDGLSVLQAVIAAVVFGAIGAWAALASV